MRCTLLVSVRFHDGRYYGAGDWPPAPARLFQALIAGAARGRVLGDMDRAGLAWLEALNPPIISVPIGQSVRGFQNFVPNNDLDAVGGDPGRIGEIRTSKAIKPWFFDSTQPFLYAWDFEKNDIADKHAQIISSIAERLYQFGRGVDMAWAWAEILDDEQMESRFAGHGGVIYRPSKNGEQAKGTKNNERASLFCPQSGSLKSLEERFEANQRRFVRVDGGKQMLFSQPPRPRFASIDYTNGTASRIFLFDMRQSVARDSFAPWQQEKVSHLVVAVRDGAANRLEKALPEKSACIERVFIGRDTTSMDKETRVRIVPIPSVGHLHVDHAIRRIMVEVPPNCPIPAIDVAWGFSGLSLGDDVLLLPSEDYTMLSRHYKVENDPSKRRWRTVTPVVLPIKAARRRIDPLKIKDRAEQKDASERIHEEATAVAAVRQALRHAQIFAYPEEIRVQREPFDGKGARAESFAAGTRFAKERLWHIEITFADTVSGPLIIGDGRYMGLGLLTLVQ